jgi:lipopolysaccharide/colanic/teichoic acid biosynthesis glycosyltransferase
MLSPILLAAAIAVKACDRGPIFYVSYRYTRGARIFGMIKFRTMQKNAESLVYAMKDKNEAGGPMFKIKNDSRITKIGTFLRKYSIDELPQLFNVLKGDMSLVGPRPLTVDLSNFSDHRQIDRLTVLSGMTGPWQVSGRSNITYERMIKLDIEYIKTLSFINDIKILVKTVAVVLNGNGAY